MAGDTDPLPQVDGFMPHGMCYLWQPGVLGLHVISDALITLAYLSIPFTLIYFVRKRPDLEFNWMFVCFAVFIVACGTTHAMEIWVVWHPDYWLSGTVKAVTALASVPTAILLVRLVPVALNIPSPATLRLAYAKLETEVTERRRTEQELRNANEQLRDEAARERLAAIVESSEDAIISKTREGTITSWNRGAENIFGYSPAEAIGRSIQMLIPAEHAAEEAQILARITRGERTGSFETVRLRKGSERIAISATISPIRDSSGAIVGASKIARDITARKRVEAERRDAERKLAHQLERLQLLNAITQAIGERQDLASIFQIVIRTLEDQLPVDFGCFCLHQPPEMLSVARVGVKCAELASELGLTEHAHIEIGHNGLSRCVRGQLVYEPDLQRVKVPFAQRLAAAGLHAMVAAPLLVEGKVFAVLIVARHAANSFSSGECEFLLQLSQHVALAAQQTQLYRTLQVAYEDLRETQQAVMRHEKLRVLGQMASGIAHDINNALSPAALYIESLLAPHSELSPKARELLVIIERAVDGVAQTVSRMKEFYGQRDPEHAYTLVSVNRAAEQVVALTRPRWSSLTQESGIVVQLVTDLANDLPAITGDEGEIRDALTNLILNAVDAMPRGGLITVRSRAVGPDRVSLEVVDTGVGMDEATRNRCLELFFTTKGTRGTGLGLAMVYGTVERHGGELHIESAPGAGTTIQMIFPVPASVPVSPSASTGAHPRLPLRILAVDDDPLVLNSIRHVLEEEGHLVEIADGGQRGIDAFRAAIERSEPFAVVLTDLGMPQVDGRAVAAAVKTLRPEVPVILLTGWGQRLMADNDIPEHVDRVLGKPTKLVELRTALADLTNL